MLLATSFILASTALQIQFLTCKTEHFQFVKSGDKVVIQCSTGEKIENRGQSFSLYKRKNNGIPVLIKSCMENNTTDRFLCRHRNDMPLEIEWTAQTDDSGVYLCAKRYENFCLGSSVVVGDSYHPNATVTLLHSGVQEPTSPLAQSSGQLACVVHGVSNLVQISWNVSGDLQPEVPTFLVKNRTGVLTFASLLHLPADVCDSGNNFTCEVRFNSSVARVKETIIFGACSSGKPEDGCCQYAVPLVAVGIPAVLLLLLIVFGRCLCPSMPGFQPKISAPAPSEVPEEALCYAQLDLPLRKEDKKREPSGASQGKHRRI